MLATRQNDVYILASLLSSVDDKRSRSQHIQDLNTLLRVADAQRSSQAMEFLKNYLSGYAKSSQRESFLPPVNGEEPSADTPKVSEPTHGSSVDPPPKLDVRELAESRIVQTSAGL